MTKSSLKRISRKKTDQTTVDASKPKTINIETATIEELRPIAVQIFTKVRVLTEENGLLTGLVTDLRTDREILNQTVASLQAELAKVKK